MKGYLQSVSQDLTSQKDFAHSLDSLRNQDNFFLCSLSGGQDSISLFFLLFHFLKTLAISSEKETLLTVFYCHHFWQPKNVFLLSFLFQITVLFHCEYFVSFSKKTVPNENRSRQLRKKSLSRISILQNSTTLLTGHTETDRIETLFINLIRGTTVKNFSYRKIFYFKKEEIFLFSSFNQSSMNIFCLKNGFIDPTNQKNVQFQKVKFSCSPFFVLFSQESRLSQTHILGTVDQCNPLSNFKIYFTNQIGISNKKSKTLGERAPNYFSGKLEKRHKQQRTHFFYRQKPYKKFQFLKRKQNLFSFFQKISPNSVSPPICRVNSQFLKENDFRFQTASSSSFSFYSFSSVEVSWWKPLMTTKRLFVRNCLDFYQFPVLTDLTNFSYQFSRNKIRHQFIPFLKSFFHEKVDRVVLQCFQIEGEEHEIIENQMRELLLIALLAESLFVLTLAQVEPRNPAKWFLANISHSLQLAFLQNLLFLYRNREGTFLQISALKNRLFLSFL